ncbi:MAG: hypothetical protein AAF242_04415, partial [Bacteroidota bacterium]
SFEQITTDHFGYGYGYGMSIRNLNNQIIIGHNGGAPGAAGEVDMMKDSSLIIVTISNRSPMEGWAQVRTFLRKTFFGSTPSIDQFLNTEKLVDIYETQGLGAANIFLAEVDNQIGVRYLDHYAEEAKMAQNLQTAIELGELNVLAHPEEWVVYSFLADYYLEASQTEKAKENYQRSLELNPENEMAIEQLAKME